MPSSAASHVAVEMSHDEESIAIEELMQMDACRIAREILEAGVCPWCREATLRLLPIADRYAFTCRCAFQTPPA